MWEKNYRICVSLDGLLASNDFQIFKINHVDVQLNILIWKFNVKFQSFVNILKQTKIAIETLLIWVNGTWMRGDHVQNISKNHE